MNTPDIAIIGGGLMGRCLAWRVCLTGARVALYDSGSSRGEGAAAWVERKLAFRGVSYHVDRLDSARLSELEPALAQRFPEALHVPDEAQVDNRELLAAVGIALNEASVECHWQTLVENCALPQAGLVVDCRGIGAKLNLPKLRGVRGEIIRLHAPEIELNHVLRLLHPRYPVYVVPRAEGKL